MSTTRLYPLISLLFLLPGAAFAQDFQVTRTDQEATDKEQFGTRFAVDGPWMVANAPGRTRGGVVDIYKEDAASKTWKVDTTIQTPRSSTGDDKCGESVALHKDRLLIGCPGFGRGNGIVYAYWRHPTEGWIHVNTLKPPTNAGGFGSHVSLSKDFAALVADQTKLYHCATAGRSETPVDVQCRTQDIRSTYTKISALASDGNFAIVAGTISSGGSNSGGGATLLEFRATMPDVPWIARRAKLEAPNPFQSADISHEGNGNPQVIIASDRAPVKIYEITGQDRDMVITHSIEGDAMLGMSKDTRVAMAGKRAIIGSPEQRTSVLLGQKGKEWLPLYHNTKTTVGYGTDVAIFADAFYVSSPEARVGLKQAGTIWAQKLFSFTYTYDQEIAANHVVHGIGPNNAELLAVLKDSNDNKIDEALFRGNGFGQWRFPINAFQVLPDGKYTLSIEDVNASTDPIKRDVSIKGTSSVTITNPAYGEHTNKQRINAEGDCGGNQKVLITLKKLSDTQGTTVDASCGPGWRLNPNNNLPEGTYLIFVMPQAKPAQTVATKFTIDLTDPILTMSGAPVDTNTPWAVDVNDQLGGQCTDNGKPCVQAPIKVTIGVDQQDITTKEDGSFSFGLPQGLDTNTQHTLTVSVTDRAGNIADLTYTLAVSGTQVDTPVITEPSVDGHQFFSIDDIGFGFTATSGVPTTVTLEEFDGNDDNEQPTFKAIAEGTEEIDGDQTNWFWTNTIDWEAGIYRVTLETTGSPATASRVFTLVGEFDFKIDDESSTTNNLAIGTDVVLTGNVDCESCLVDVLLNDEESQYVTTTDDNGDWRVELTGLAETIDEIDVEIYQPYGDTAYLVALGEVDVVVTTDLPPTGNAPQKLETSLCGTTTLPHGPNPLPLLLMLLGGVLVICRRRQR